jgi:hypothetical protein
MSFVQEYQLRQLLSNLVEVWPEDCSHPLVDEARAYLQTHPHGYLASKQAKIDTAPPGEYDEDHTSMWYSL